jgi:hypothetical protein
MTPKLNELPGRRTLEARARHRDAKSAASQGLIGNPLKTAAINRDELAIASTPWRLRKQVSNTAKVPFPFLADVSHRDNRSVEVNMIRLRSSKCPQQCDDSSAVI